MFPACEACNNVSRRSEAVLGLLVHGSHDAEDRQAYLRVVASMSREYPDLIESMLFKRNNEVRHELKRLGVDRPKYMTLRDVPLIKLNPEFWIPHFEMFGRKMMLALHYKIFKKPLSRSGFVAFFVHTNADAVTENFPQEFLEFTNLTEIPMRAGKNLADQFELYFQSEPSTGTGLWNFSIHKRLAFTGVTTETSDIYTAFGGSHFPPFLG